jgi:subtilisin family serine protease
MVAVVDTGLDLEDKRFSDVLCATGHRDFTNTGLKDNVTHGTHVTGLIKQYAGDVDCYCLIIIKWYDPAILEKKYTITTMTRALDYALNSGALYVNVSGGGGGFDEYEYDSIKNHPEVLVIAAAGNEGRNIDIFDNAFYPASYVFPNVVPVSALNHSRRRLESSDWSSRSAWELGENVQSTIPGGMAYASGTSMATAIHTGRVINEICR